MIFAQIRLEGGVTLSSTARDSEQHLVTGRRRIGGEGNEVENGWIRDSILPGICIKRLRECPVDRRK
jgi:hypothetical protein